MTDPDDLRLSDKEKAWLRLALVGPVVGFSTQGGAVQSLSPHVFQASVLIVHATESTVIDTTSVDVAPRDEIFPIAVRRWGPESLPWAYVPAVAPIEPKAEEGLDLTTPLGRIVEMSVFSIAEPPFGEVKEVTEFDTGLLLAVDGWRLLVESIEHTDHWRVGVPMDLALSTDAATIDERLAKGMVRRIDDQATA